MLTQQKQRPCDKTDEGSKIEKREIFRKKTKKRGTSTSRKDERTEKACVFSERGKMEREGQEKKASLHISAAITVGNGSHLSHLDISEDL